MRGNSTGNGASTSNGTLGPYSVCLLTGEPLNKPDDHWGIWTGTV